MFPTAAKCVSYSLQSSNIIYQVDAIIRTSSLCPATSSSVTQCTYPPFEATPVADKVEASQSPPSSSSNSDSQQVPLHMVKLQTSEQSAPGMDQMELTLLHSVASPSKITTSESNNEKRPLQEGSTGPPQKIIMPTTARQRGGDNYHLSKNSADIQKMKKSFELRIYVKLFQHLPMAVVA